jgi:spoIIIJ-associated protein
MPIIQKEYKGKNVDEAIATACTDLNTSLEALDIEIVSAGSAGIFGLCKKKAIILASRKELTPVRPDANHDGEGRPVSNPRHHPKSLHNQVRPKNTPKREAISSRPETAAPFPPSQEVQNEIKELLSTLLRLMDCPSEISLSTSGNKLTAHILATDNADEIIGRDGSTLDALQYLLRKIVSQKFPEKINLNLDAGTYRKDRQKELEALAIEMANKVKATGKSQIISALNPAERRIVHVTLQDDTGIRSSSLGEGLFKKVRISLPDQGRTRSSSHGRRKSFPSEDSSSS